MTRFAPSIYPTVALIEIRHRLDFMCKLIGNCFQHHFFTLVSPGPKDMDSLRRELSSEAAGS